MEKYKRIIELREQGVSVLGCRFRENHVLCNFTLPKKEMKKFKKLSLVYDRKNVFLELLIASFNFKQTEIKEVMYWQEFKNNNTINKRKHSDYEFTSCSVSYHIWELLEKYCSYYNLSRSQFIRFLVDTFETDMEFLK